MSDVARAVQFHHSFAADRPHRVRPEIFRILFALTWYSLPMIPCQRGIKPPKLPLFLGFCHPSSHGHMHHAQKIGRDRACGSGDVLAARQTKEL